MVNQSMRDTQNAARSAGETLAGLQNPFPFFAEATQAASKFFQAQSEYLKISAELRARREAKRAAFFVAAFVLVNVMLILTLFWASHALYDAGFSAWAVALTALVIFGSAAGLCAYLGIQAGKGPDRSSQDTHSGTGTGGVESTPSSTRHYSKAG